MRAAERVAGGGGSTSTLNPDIAGAARVGYVRMIALIVAATYFMESLDGSVVVTTLPNIAADFNTTVLAAGLSITWYLLAMAAFVPAAGWCADRFGARRVFMVAVGSFTITSLLCALSPSLLVFVASRFVQGAAAAFMSPVGRLVVLRETPKQRLIEAMNTITWPGLIAPVLGPPLGGLIALHLSWRWIFVLNLPLGLSGLWLIWRRFPAGGIASRGRFDTVGFVLTALALAALIDGLTMLGERRGGFVPPLALLAAGGVLLGLATRYWMRTPEPMLDLRALRVRTFVMSSVTAGFCFRIAMNAAPFLLPLMFEIGFGMNTAKAGSMLLVYMAGNVAMKLASTPALRRFGFRRVLWGNGLLCAATLYACGILSPADPVAVMCLVLFVAGMSRSMNFSALTNLVFADIPAEQRAGASTLATMLQQLAQTFGVALGATALGISQSSRAAPSLQLVDFRYAWIFIGTVMLSAVMAMRKLDRDAGIGITGRS